MTAQEEKLKEAFAEAAIEETEQLENSLTYEEQSEAEDLYRRHRDTALRQIRKQKVSVVKWVSGIAAAAAAVLLVVWGLNRSAPDIITPISGPDGPDISVVTAEPKATETVTSALPADEAAPDIPVLEGRLVDFPEGKRYAVYTGPGENYERANQDTAAVSTNGWIQVFGVENGYAMIQYAVSSTQNRIGYIGGDSLPDSSSVAALEFAYMPVVLTREAELTDDPLGEKAPLRTLPAGTEARWLAVMDGWAYLEWTDEGKPVRGFVPADAILQKNNE